MQRAGDPSVRESCLRDYRRTRNQYFAAVKREAWEKFVTEEGNKDPWGIPYKILAEKQKKELLISSMKFDNEYEHDVEQLAKKLMHVLLPDDSAEDKQSELQIRRESELIGSTEESQLIAEEEIWSALSTMGKKKAPGYDELTVEIWIKPWPVVRQKVLDIMNRCLREGRFPAPWKIGLMKILYKGNEKDPQDPKSYRPLTLLPVLGKVYEKVINKRILGSLQQGRKLHEKQYGFRPGRGTEGALIEVVEKVKNSRQNYVAAVFLDIAGASTTLLVAQNNSSVKRFWN